jgi:hypothetical protein
MALSEKSFWAHTDENAHHADDSLFADLRTMFASGKQPNRPESSLSAESVTENDSGSLKRDAMKKRVRKPIVINDDKILQALGNYLITF